MPQLPVARPVMGCAAFRAGNNIVTRLELLAADRAAVVFRGMATGSGPVGGVSAALKFGLFRDLPHMGYARKNAER